MADKKPSGEEPGSIEFEKSERRDPASGPKQQLSDRQTGERPDIEREQQPVVAHQDRRHK